MVKMKNFRIWKLPCGNRLTTLRRKCFTTKSLMNLSTMKFLGYHLTKSMKDQKLEENLI